ncbi:D-tyrosyl-tRNA(Tyr) deacylase [Legionella qingyii]|uniref:D-aminoacyl-tRNA deacylase n=1 Tax=Legionella qingyii TaxID=2184757 RepID=A0A317U314_9GAMM|nr:D-aminoacyl-tRNA deacylase [Legionella qingyii]PWY56434.1 D-tyrosyl-tRNA(Tyr) deacylase [Legionella qingyii]PWY57209.1 D-tyrosyl-tRNA(Tyr) deacylase [Legionella qingyii]RUR24951.1 D-tyrosyl-tRNA(Tyr) deacylase [Legionella qingyii]RUR28776.1 D-tyrosyl-tRNA(Tyr) deacylase [Legionella qingyii]
MLIVIQRVAHARVDIDGETVGKIDQGLLVLCGFEPDDTDHNINKMLEKCINYRIFSDSQGKMNLSLKDVQGGLLLVPQFTLMAETQKGLRPSFSNAAPPELGRQLFDNLLTRAAQLYPHIQSGCFGADMQVHLCNDGPVTFLLKF